MAGRSRWVMGLAVAAVAVLLCVGAAERATARARAASHRFVHVHEFLGMGVRIAPPTGTARLTWEQALRAGERQQGGWNARTPPQVKLADYRDSFRGPMRPVLAWIVVYPDAEVVEFGASTARHHVDHCPAYVVVDATSGRGWGAFQTCEPAYRG